MVADGHHFVFLADTLSAMLHTKQSSPTFIPIMLFFSTLIIACQDKQTDSSTIPQIQVSTCAEPLPAIPWSDDGFPVEGIEGIEEEIANLDLSQLPDPVPIGSLLPLFRGVIAYVLEIPPADLSNEITHAQALEKGKLGEALLGSLLLGQEDPNGIDFSFLRRGIHEYYTCSKGFPLTLTDFQLLYGDYESMPGVSNDSIAKCNVRNLITPYPDVFIAESVVDGVVRETEILLLNNRSDGQLDFLVYDENGMLTNRTQFPTLNNGPHVVTSSPYACMTCHLNPNSAPNVWGYDLIVPETGPCR